jgi:predicted lysophospholipase L1 biosynthesis ABC-type transport system permease subunit
MRLAIPASVYGTSETDGRGPLRQRLYDRLEKAVQAVPGVEAAAVTALLPLRQFWDPWAVSVEGRPPLPPDRFGGGGVSRRTGIAYHGTTAIQRVTPGYFAALGMPLIQGRLFDDHDRPDAPRVVLLNETAARKFFPADDPIGKRVRTDMTSDAPAMTIVGVVRDSRLTGMDREVSSELFWPMAYAPSVSGWIVARSSRGSESIDAVRSALADAEPEVAIAETATMSSVLNDSLWQPRLAAFVIGAFAVLGVLIATFGLYAVISHAVVRQTRELGVRRALGASGRRIATAVLRHGLRVTAVGIVLGSLVATAINRLSTHTIPDLEVSPWDVTHVSAHAAPSLNDAPWILAAVAALLLLLTILACWVPIRKALAVDPMMTLRME